MTDIQFYHLTSPLERILPKLLEKSLERGFRVLVKLGSDESTERMNGWLWTYNPDAFLPHGTKKDGYEESQPVYLTSADENPNAADLVIITDGSEIEPEAAIKRLFDIVDAGDEAALKAAEARMKRYREEGHTVACVRQSASGGWEKQAA